MTDDRLERLERRVQYLEDQHEIARLLSAYGPLVDAGRATEVAALWEPDGVYDVDEIYLSGQEELAAMVRSRAHQSLIAGGCAHFLGPPHITVHGDDAVAVCHSLLIVHDESGYRVRRATAHHWTLRRGPDGWRARTRTSRLLDGRAESALLLGTGAMGLGLEEST